MSGAKGGEEQRLVRPAGEVAPSVHGLDGAFAAPDWPPIGEADLAILGARFPETLRGAAIEWRSPRPFAACALLRSGAGAYFVKRHDARVRDGAGLREEHAFLAHLREHGVAVPRVLRDIDGRGAIPTSRGIFEVHEAIAGADLYRDVHSWEPVRDEAHAHALGRMLARMHVAAGGFDAPARPARPLLAGFEIVGSPDCPAAVAQYVGERPALESFLGGQEAVRELARALAPWHEALQAHASELTPLWAHNDLHASNAMWSADGAEVVGVFDFGLANRTCALADLATTIERNAVAWLEQGQGGAIGRPAPGRAILAGYSQALPLSSARRAALRALLPLAHVEFALSEADYYAGVLGDRERASLACRGFLIGHLQWFGSREGSGFLRDLLG